jgi:2-polyprenyl-3-methyl-5-hydroxy-6-metoxy-1,4-benzoquinol methylase
MPVPENIQDHYGIPPESYWREGYQAWTTDYFSVEISLLRKLMNVESGMKSLDIGAGLGKCMLSLDKAGFQSYGLEPSIPFYERAISVMNIPAERLKLGQIESTDYPPAEFDFITFGAVFEHLYRPKECLQKALNWLKPGGIIHLEVPSSKHLISRLINLYFILIGTNYVTNLSPMHSPFHLYEFDLKSFKAASLSLKYEIVHYKYDVCDIAPIPKILQPLFSRLMKYSNTGMQLTVFLKKL